MASPPPSASPRDVRVLLTEGSSLTSREVVTCLGPRGYRLEALDADPLCVDRFSRWVRRVHRCPPAGADPLGYLQTLERVVARRRIDVVLPTHEQAWLLASARPLLTARVRVAVAEAKVFERVQSKLAFARLLDELGLPQPAWRPVRGAGDLADLRFPYWLKTAFSTAGQGVREVVDARSREHALAALLDRAPLMAQQPASGRYGQVQGLFDRGRLVAAHTSVQRATGIGGSAAARLSVDHAAPRMHIAALGEALRWHGGLTLDYLHEHGSPQYIECNPRTVEPGNAAASGVNIAELQVRLTLGEHLDGPARVGRAGVRTHGAIAMLLGAAARGESRSSLLRGMGEAVAHRGVCAVSGEQLTPLLRDPPSALAAAYVAARIMLEPRAAAEIAGRAVSGYAIDPASVAQVQALVAAGTGAGAGGDPPHSHRR
ncbi:MAG: carbamoyl-phosphate-synthetase [Solirubrobacteraceae bacterium]